VLRRAHGAAMFVQRLPRGVPPDAPVHSSALTPAGLLRRSPALQDAACQGAAEQAVLKLFSTLPRHEATGCLLSSAARAAELKIDIMPRTTATETLGIIHGAVARRPKSRRPCRSLSAMHSQVLMQGAASGKRRHDRDAAACCRLTSNDCRCSSYVRARAWSPSETMCAGAGQPKVTRRAVTASHCVPQTALCRYRTPSAIYESFRSLGPS
jgi:hypothetical protein